MDGYPWERHLDLGFTEEELDALNGRLSRHECTLERVTAKEAVWRKVVFICGESGMGKTYMAKHFLEVAASEGCFVKEVSFANKVSSTASRSLSTLVRNLKREVEGVDERRVLFIDDFPPTDECDLERQKRCVDKIVTLGFTVVICVRPEAVQLLEEMRYAIVIDEHDLLIGCEGISDGRLYGNTHGIVGLVSCFLEDGGGARQSYRASLFRAMAGIVRTCFRNTLPREEQQARLAMVLLGEGSQNDLSEALPRLASDTLYWLEEDAPLFGINAKDGTFTCGAFRDHACFAACARAMVHAVEVYPEVACSCAEILCRRGSYRRSAAITSLLPIHEGLQIVREWGVEFVCSGEVAIVRRLLDTGTWANRQDDDVAMVKHALALVDEPASKFLDDSWLQMAHMIEGRAQVKMRHLTLLRTVRDLDRGIQPPRDLELHEDDDELSALMIAHIEARTMIYSGHYVDAYKKLVNDPRRLAPTSLMAQLLSDDYLIAQVLFGEEASREEASVHLAVQELMSQGSSTRLARYRAHLMTALMVLAGRETKIEGIESSISLADKMGDSAIASAYLLASAVADNRTGQYARAHVRALQSSARMTASFDGKFVRIARLVDAFANFELDEPELLLTCARSPLASEERDVAQYFCGEAMLGQMPQPDVIARSAPVGDASWLLNMACYDFDDLSLTFRRSAPPSWCAAARRVVRKAQSLGQLIERTAKREFAESASQGEELAMVPEEEARIRVRLLGGFSITVDGVEVPPRLLERRRARSFFIYLASRKGHFATRFELIEEIWSDYDFEEGKQRIYEATSAVRNAIGFRRDELDVFVGVRSNGHIQLSPSLFSVDVDRFERMARAAVMSGEDGETTVALACAAVDEYQGELCETTHDARGEVRVRRHQLAELFADASVTGAKAAPREGRLSLATRLARGAFERSPRREDVVIVLMEALRASGRIHEAREAYFEYAARIGETPGLTPSKRLMDLAGDITRDANRQRRVKRTKRLTQTT